MPYFNLTKKVYFQVINPSKVWPLIENLRAPSHMAIGATALIKVFIIIWSESVLWQFSATIGKELVAPIMRVQLSDLGKKLEGK